MNVQTQPYRKSILPHSCAIPSCPVLTHDKYCINHKHIQSEVSRETRGTTSEQGYGTQWQKVRARYISLHPLCEDCKSQGVDRPVQEVHHILELRLGGTNEDDNLQSLCKSCHSKHTRMRQDAIGLGQRVYIEGNYPKGRGR